MTFYNNTCEIKIPLVKKPDPLIQYANKESDFKLKLFKTKQYINDFDKGINITYDDQIKAIDVNIIPVTHKIYPTTN